MAFQVPKQNPAPPTEYIKRTGVNLAERRGILEAFYAAFEDEEHYRDLSREPLRDVAVINVTGPTVQPLLDNARQLMSTEEIALLEGIAERLTDAELAAQNKAVTIIKTTTNRVYNDTKELTNRLFTQTATAQELEDVRGWEQLGQAVLVPGAEYVGDGFELSEVGGE